MDEPPPTAHVDDRRAERFSLVLGLTLAVSGLVAIGAVAFVDPPLGLAMLGQVSAHAVVGRETGIPTGHALGLPIVVVGVLAATQDLCILLVGYPLAAAVGRGALKIPFLDRFVHKPHPKRERFAQRTQIAGTAILALSLWIPFFPGGAFVGSLLARAAGYHPRLFLPALAVSALGADLTYVVFTRYVGERFGYVPVLIFVATVVAGIAVGAFVVSRVRKGRGADE